MRWQLAVVVFCVWPLLLELGALCSLSVRSALVRQRPVRPSLWRLPQLLGASEQRRRGRCP